MKMLLCIYQFEKPKHNMKKMTKLLVKRLKSLQRRLKRWKNQQYPKPFETLCKEKKEYTIHKNNTKNQ